MVVLIRRICASKRYQLVIFVSIILLITLYFTSNSPENLDITRRLFPASLSNNTVQSSVVSQASKSQTPLIQQASVVFKNTSVSLGGGKSNPDNLNSRESIVKYIEHTLEEALKVDKGTGCQIPPLDPFAPEIMKFNKNMNKIVCKRKDLVKCYLSKCKVVEEAVKGFIDFSCTYRDIIYESDAKYDLGASSVLTGIHEYTLNKSDHVKIQCTGKTAEGKSMSWTGYGWGIRSSIKYPVSPAGREYTINVLIFGFDSTAHNGFIRKMPLSYNVLIKELGATVLKGYNIVGDGTPAALLPILTGKTELELPEARKSVRGSGFIDEKYFLFHKLRNDGYRTSYLEDMPWVGTFQYRFNGFQRQPADHYARAFYLEESKTRNFKNIETKYCVGDTPQYQLMMNVTEQFFKLGGKRFAFTFIADIAHDNFNIIGTADEGVAEFLRNIKRNGYLENTLVIVMGDHGPRYSDVRNTYQGKLEERLPLMAIRLPEQLKMQRPDAQKALDANINVLTTPHDIHATILDALDLRQYWNPYKLKGADLPRGLTLLEPVPSNRSCSEADIQPHWCSCLHWEDVPMSDPLHLRVAQALVSAINGYTEFQRSKCAVRVLKSIEWVMKSRLNAAVLQFAGARDKDGYLGSFSGRADRFPLQYQLKVTVSPGHGVFEAVVTHDPKTDKIQVDNRQISRANLYGKEPSCISATYPHINMYCYCINNT